MADEKRCPKCADQPIMKPNDTVYVLPAALDNRFPAAGKIFSDKAGIEVSVFECPRCHFVEFYGHQE